jgi:hypothetical protein
MESNMTSKQYPIQSGFGAQTSATEVIRGIGLETTSVLAAVYADQ